MKKLLGSLALLFGLTFCSIAEQVSLAWCPSPGPNVSNYNIYFSAGPVITNWIPSIYSSTTNPCGSIISEGTNWYRNYTNKVSVGNVTGATISGLLSGKTYYFTTTATDTTGLESDLSNEAMYTVPYPVIAYTFSLSSINNVVTRGTQASLIFTANTNITTNVFLSITYSGTANTGVDYSLVTNVYVFPQGSISYTQYIDTIKNTLPDTNKTLIATLLNGTNYVVGNSNVEFTLVPVTILPFTNTVPTEVKDFQLLKMQ